MSDGTTMTRHLMGDAAVTVYLASADGDLGLSLGAFAEIAMEGRPTALWREAGEDWSRTRDTLDSLRARDALVHECDLNDVEPDRLPGLRRLLEQVALAKRIATAAHAGQEDKNGDRYVDHPARVAGRVGTLRGQAAAWLHDVLEDTEVDVAALFAAGLEIPVIRAVVALTRLAHVPDSAYYAGIRADAIALDVKLADIADNTDPARTARLDPEVRERLARKYDHARRALGAEEERA